MTEEARNCRRFVLKLLPVISRFTKRYGDTAKEFVPGSDIGMPEMDDYMLIHQVRSHSTEQGGLVKAIALAAYAGEIN